MAISIAVVEICDFIGGNSSWQVTILPSLVPIDSGDIIFVVVEKQDCASSPLNPPLTFFSKGHGSKAHDISCLLVRNWSPAPIAEIHAKYKISFFSPSKITDGKEKRKTKTGSSKAFFVTHKRKQQPEGY